MTDREKAIVMAYTRIAMLKGEKINEFYKYLAELYGRPVYTHEIVTLDIAEKAKPDFIRLCEETTDIRTETHSCDYGKEGTHGDVIYRADAIDAIRHIEEIYVNNLPTMIDKASAQTELVRLPSAEPEIIRCQYCKHNTSKPNAGNASCELFYGMSDQYGFCHRAERRTDE